MIRWQTIAAVLLLALWMPVTSHCAMGFAGLGASEACCPGDAREYETFDFCSELESNLYRAAGDSLAVKKPRPAGACLLCGAVFLVPVRICVPVRSTHHVDRADDWVPHWNFEHRTALPARAPSCG